jgi:hypothetical protein
MTCRRRLLLLACIGMASSRPGPAAAETVPFEAPKFGVKLELPETWRLIGRERDEFVFIAEVPQTDPDRPGACACELGLAPASLDEYCTRIDANARQGRRPGTLVRNELVKTPRGDRLETLWEFRPRQGLLWRELSIRIIAHRQLYTFLLNVDDAAWPKAKADFDALLDSVVLTPPNTGADLVEPKSNRWAQREFRFALELPEGWQPALAPNEIALLYANGPVHGIWADNVLVIAEPHQPRDLERLRRALPEDLQAADPNCEVLSCTLIKQNGRDALETIVRTRRGPFSMTVLERRFKGDRFDYETKFTVESQRFDELLPTLRNSLDSFRELPGPVPALGGKPA